jgi:hypothetical protein
MYAFLNFLQYALTKSIFWFRLVYYVNLNKNILGGVMSEQVDFVDILFQKIEDLLLNHNNSAGASLVLYVLSVASCRLGWDKPDETKKFAENWNKVKEKIVVHADKCEFMSQTRMIEDNIAQALDKETYSYATHRAKSALSLHQKELLYFLEETFR